MIRLVLITSTFQKSLSDWQRVYLSRVSLASSGHYRCEVSAEGPSFSSVSGGGHMEVGLGLLALIILILMMVDLINLRRWLFYQKIGQLLPVAKVATGQGI